MHHTVIPYSEKNGIREYKVVALGGVERIAKSGDSLAIVSLRTRRLGGTEVNYTSVGTHPEPRARICVGSADSFEQPRVLHWPVGDAVNDARGHSLASRSGLAAAADISDAVRAAGGSSKGAYLRTYGVRCPVEH